VRLQLAFPGLVSNDTTAAPRRVQAASTSSRLRGAHFLAAAFFLPFFFGASAGAAFLPFFAIALGGWLRGLNGMAVRPGGPALDPGRASWGGYARVTHIEVGGGVERPKPIEERVGPHSLDLGAQVVPPPPPTANKV